MFSSGFSYLYVIKRCPNGQIFDAKKQKCVRNTFDDPACSNGPPQGRPRTTTMRMSLIQNTKRKQEIKRPISLPPTSLKLLKSKNFDHEDVEHDEFVPTQPTMSSTIEHTDDSSGNMRRVCYVANWSRFRSGEAKFEIEYIDPFMCSHLVYAYATVDDSKPEIVPVQKEDIGLKLIKYDRFIR